MGGFLLLSKDGEDPLEELEKKHRAAIAVFEKKGLKLRKKIVNPNFLLFVYNKHALQNQDPGEQDQYEFDNGDFIVSTGTSMYQGKTGALALRALHQDFSRHQKVPADLLGTFCMILLVKDKLFIFNDYTGLYRIYCNPSKTVLSSSFLAVVKTLPERKLSRQEFYEYLFHETFYGEKTILQQIDLLDSNKVWQVWPHISSDQREVTGSDLQGGGSFDDLVARVSNNLTGYFQILKNIFGDDIISSLSGGYDSRLMLALMRKVGICPHLFVYGREDSDDVTVAKAIAQGERLELEHIDKSAFPQVQPHTFCQVLQKTYYLFDGLGTTGVFDNGSDVATRIRRAQQARLHINGGGGEIYRSVWHMPETGIDIEKLLQYRYGPIHILEDFVDYSICGDRFHKGKYISGLKEKIKAIVKTRRDWLTKPHLVVLYSFLRHKYWMGMNHSLDNQFSYALTPCAESRFVFESFSIPATYRAFGRFEAALIRSIDPQLATYPSVYGWNFSGPVPWHKRIFKNTRQNLPYFLRPVLPVLHRKIRQRRFRPPFYFGPDYLREIFADEDFIIGQYVDISKVRDESQLSRVLSVELLIRDRF